MLLQTQRFRKDGMAYDGRPVSRWLGAAAEQRAVFVDETSCIGCTHCNACAPNTFFMVRTHCLWASSGKWLQGLAPLGAHTVYLGCGISR